MDSDGDWSEVDARALGVLARFHGVAKRKDFLRAGLTPLQVAAVFRRGVIERPRNAWYVDPALSWQAKCAVRVGGVLTCVSAAASYGVPVPPRSARRTHVRVATNTPRVRHSRDSSWYAKSGHDPGVELHWTDCLDAPVGWRVGPVDCLLQLARCVPVDWFVAALDAVLHRPRGGEPMLSTAEYERLVRHLPERLHPALRLVDPRAESPLETLLRLGLVRRSIGPWDLQVWPSPGCRVDIVVRGKLILEADGKSFHDEAADRVRDALLRGLGYRVLRFDSDRILDDLESVLDEIDAELRTMFVL